MPMNTLHRKSLRHDQTGMASFLITIFIMLVIGLIVMGFAQLTRRDQRQSLDRQLSVQAQYAAETGVNDAVRYLQTHPTFEKSDCNEVVPGQLISGYNDTLDAAGGVSYQCVLIDATPGDLKKQDVGINSNIVFPVQLASGSPVTSITFQWSNKSLTSPSGCPGTGSYPTSGCNFPTLRGDIVPYPTTGSPSRDSLLNGLYTFYANPSGGGSAAYSSNAGSNPQSVGGSCSGAVCSITITGLSADRYFVRLNAIYGVADVTVLANGGGAANSLQGAQAVIDATGKASDVVKRIQVRVPLAGTDGIPGFALQTQNSQCKRYGTIPSTNQVFLISPNDDCSL